MSALLALADPTIVAFAHEMNLIIGAQGSKGLVDAVRNFVGPLFLLAIGIAAMSFLFQRQMTQFLQFIVLAVGIAVLFYFPGVVESIAQFFSKAF